MALVAASNATRMLIELSSNIIKIPIASYKYIYKFKYIYKQVHT